MTAPVPHLGTGDGAIGRELLPQPIVIYPIIQVLHVQVDPLQTGKKKKVAWAPEFYSSFFSQLCVSPVALQRVGCPTDVSSTGLPQDR